MSLSVSEDPVKLALYPEIQAGGFSSVDGTIEFYDRVNALISPTDTVLDFGAGRGAWFHDDLSAYRRALRLLRGKARKVIGSDVDPIVLENQSLDQALVTTELERLPIDDSSIDLIVSDYVLEHIAAPDVLSAEFFRVLKKGGWVCCRTPNKFGYVSVATRLISNRFHKRVLQRAQSHRKAEDVFPTLFRLNSMRAVRRAFPKERWVDCSYYYDGEPAYHFGSQVLGGGMRIVNKLLPRPLSGNLFIFLCKR